MKIGLYLYGVGTLDVGNRHFANMQGDEIIALAWKKYLENDHGHSVSIFSEEYPVGKDEFDVIVYFNMNLKKKPHSGKNIAYLQNSTADADEILKKLTGMKEYFNAFMFCSGLVRSKSQIDGLIVPFAYDSDSIGVFSKELEYDISFLGNALPRTPHWIEDFIVPMYSFNSAIFSKSPWPASAANLWKGGLPLQQTHSLYYSSKLNLNVHIKGHAINETLNFRVFDVLGSCGCLISDWFKELENVFEDSILYTSGGMDMIEKVKKILADEPRRKRMVEKGKAIVDSGHTFRHRAASINAFLKEAI